MKLLKTLQSHPVLSGVAAVIVGVATIAATTFAWGPNRQLYTMEHPADHPTFNSITNNPNYGDERGFTTVKDVTTGSGYGHNTTLVPGHEYEVQIYIHNNASEIFNENGTGIAHDVTVRAAISASVSGTDTVDGFISSSNAEPGLVYDSANITSTGKVDLQYVTGSAMLYTNHQTTKLSDSVITTGVKVGSNDLSGDWLGCLNYAGYVTFHFKVKPLPVDNDVTVCEISSGKIVTIKESEQKAHPELYADKDSDKCKIEVCEISTKNVITISKAQQQAHPELYTDKDSKTCKPVVPITPVVPTVPQKPAPAPAPELPDTGVAFSALSITGLGALSYAGYAYIASRRSL